MDNNNRKKAELLGMPFGTATNRMRKQLLWRYVKQNNDDVCYKCSQRITNIDDLSIEHKIPWQSAPDPVAAFFNMDNIAFSHLKCNISAKKYTGWANKDIQHGTNSMYSHKQYKCRCDDCKKAHTKVNRAWDAKVGRTSHGRLPER